MTWIVPALGAGLLLGLYDFLTKIALKENSVLDVVFFCCLIGGLMWLPFCFMPEFAAAVLQPLALYPKSLTWTEQALLVPKSLMMVVTWVLSYYSVKSLPLSISAGVRASGPLWTALGAMVFLSEQLSWTQWLGLAIAMAAYYGFAVIGSKEGISFRQNVWVLAMLAATLLSTANAIYDKYVIASLRLDLSAVQAYSAVQRAVIGLALLSMVSGSVRWTSLFSRNWAVLAVAASYVAAEFIYLWAVSQEGAMISVIAILRRTNLVMVFGLSALLLTERFIAQKTMAIILVLVGIALTILH